MSELGAGRSTSLLGNTAIGMVPRAVTMVVALIMSPYIVSEVGLAAFGYWSIVLAVLQYAGIAGGGYPAVAMRMVSGALARGNADEIRGAIFVTVAIMLVVSLPILAVAALTVWWMPSSVAAGLPAGWAQATLWGTLALVLVLLANAFAAVSRGFGRWDYDAVIIVIAQVMGAAATVLFLESGYGLGGVAGATCVLQGSLLLGYVAAGYSLGGIRCQRPVRTARLWQELRTQGTHLQISALVGTTNSQADRIVLLPFASLSWIGAYALGARIAVSLRTFPLSAFGPFMVRIAEIDSREGRLAVTHLYRRAMAALVEYLVPGLVVLHVATYPLTLAWLGAEFTVSATAAVVLGLGYAVNVTTGAGTSAAIACGRADLDRNYNLIGLALNLALSVVLGVLFGAWGVVAATSVGLVVSSVWLVGRVDRWLERDISTQALRTRRFRRLSVLAAVVSVTCLAVTLAVAPSSRLANMAIAVLAVAIFALAALIERPDRRVLIRRAVTRILPARRGLNEGVPQ